MRHATVSTPRRPTSSCISRGRFHRRRLRRQRRQHRRRLRRQRQRRGPPIPIAGPPSCIAPGCATAWSSATPPAVPSIPSYVIALAGGGRRLGVMALVGYEPPSVIRPHERTLDKPLADRTALLEATHIDLEPALLLAEDAGQARDPPRHRPRRSRHRPAGRRAARHLLATRTATSISSAPASPSRRRIAAYQEALASRPAAIADGHHRYKVAQRFAETHHSPPGSAAAAKLAVVTSMLSPLS